jgi:chemotaxis protein CheD
LNKEVTHIDKHFLFPSTLFASQDHYIVDTVLGSCIAVCLYDTNLGYGGMNHFMMPYWNGKGLATPKYGNIAVDKLYEKMLALGSNPQNLIAKVFGGATQMNSKLSIGDRNYEVAMDQLSKHNIRIAASSVGGNKGRKIKFDTRSGQVLMKYLKGQDSQSKASAPVESHLQRKVI